MPEGRHDGVVGARQAGDGIQQDHHVALVLDQALGFFDHHLGHLVTTLEPLAQFWPAEAEHDDYFNRNPFSGYCRAVVAPKVQKFRKGFSHLMKAAA